MAAIRPREGSVSIRYGFAGAVRAVTLLYHASSSGYAVWPIDGVYGTLLSVTASTNATSANTYNVYLRDVTGEDVLQGQGAGLAETSEELLALSLSVGTANRYVTSVGPLVLEVSASASRSGKIVLTYRPDYRLRLEQAGLA